MADEHDHDIRAALEQCASDTAEDAQRGSEPDLQAASQERLFDQTPKLLGYWADRFVGRWERWRDRRRPSS